jgi:CBS domain-containing protein
MADDDISALVVVDDQELLTGIISRADLLRACVESPDWRQEVVERYMTRDVITITPDSYLDEVLELLLTKGIHRVVVVREENGGHRPIAVISDSDLVCEMADKI